MTYILIIKNKNGVVMAADRRYIKVPDSPDQDISYTDNGIKTCVNDQLKIGICINGLHSIGNQHLMGLMEDHLNAYTKHMLDKKCSLIQTMVLFPNYLKAALGAEDFTEIAKEHKKYITTIYCCRWVAGEFQMLAVQLTNIFFLYDTIKLNPTINLQPDTINAAYGNNLYSEKTYKVEDIRIISSDDSFLEKAIDFTPENIASLSLVDLEQETIKAIKTIIQTDPYFGGNPTSIKLDNTGAIQHFSDNKLDQLTLAYDKQMSPNSSRKVISLFFPEATKDKQTSDQLQSKANSQNTISSNTAN